MVYISSDPEFHRFLLVRGTTESEIVSNVFDKKCEKIISDLSMLLLNASANISKLSPIIDIDCSCMPKAGNLLAIQDELVSTSSPINNSVPIENISAFTKLLLRPDSSQKNCNGITVQLGMKYGIYAMRSNHLVSSVSGG